MKTGRITTIRLHPSDNVVIAQTDLKQGGFISEEKITCRQTIPFGHKVATAHIRAGGIVRKYGQVIGAATQDIVPGDCVHSYNIGLGDLARDYAVGADALPDRAVGRKQEFFDGILRPNGRVATRNCIGVISTVNCSSSVARMVADQFRGETLVDYPNVDGVVPVCYGYGCAMAGSGWDFEYLRNCLVGYGRHPNFAAVLFIGLGCETMQVDMLRAVDGGAASLTHQYMTIHEKGGTHPLRDVYRYSEPARAYGWFFFKDTPGYDAASVTGLVAGGANVLCFTTGRGSVFGCSPVACIKLASNSPMFNRTEEDMDINCGVVAEGKASVKEVGEQIFRRIIEVAPGSRTKSETLGMGNDEFVPWHVGAVM